MINGNVVIVDAARTAVGRFRGSLAGVRADHLGATVIEALRKRSDIPAGSIDDVIFGCVTQVGEQSANIARTSVLSAGWPETVPGLTVDRKCGSSEVALHLATAMISSGAAQIMIAAGAENMSRVPIGSNRSIHGAAFGHLLESRFEMVSQGEAAERIAEKWDFSREEMDAFSLESHRRAAAAADGGRFDREIVPVDVGAVQDRDLEPSDVVFARDETFRRDTSLEKLGGLKTSFRAEGGRITAGNSSQISDGAAAILLMTEEKALELWLKPRARIVAMTSVGSDPTLMLTGPVAATRKVLAQAGLNLEDIDLFEVNEAFAPIPMMWLKETGADPARLNANGGAIALGHPLGGSGTRLMTTLLHEMERREARFGLQSMCCAGGLATATIIERIT
jgi:acetyl-CoA acyltransferase